MKGEEAKKILQEMKDKCNDRLHKVRYVTDEEALEYAIKSLDLMGCIMDRPCEVCKYHVTGECSKWECVFNAYLIDNVYMK